ncbi:MAG TPA: hypothetical protein VK772_15975, partial [Puia sp.]|nr:hypothetical protein [Puia sp.]
MKPDLDPAGNGDFIVTEKLPPDYKGPLLRGSAVISATNDNSAMIFQQFRGQEFAISFDRYHFAYPQNIKGSHGEGFLISLLAYKNNIRYFIQGVGTLYLKAGQFALFRGSKRAVEVNVDKETQAIEISWSKEIIDQAIPFFPFLKQFVENPLPKNSFYLGKSASRAGFRTLGLIHELLHNPYDDQVSPLFYENKIRELLMSLLVDSRKKRPKKQQLTREEEQKIRDIGELISTQINNKFPIVPLARKAGMNELKLKTAFKEIFGKAI